MHIHKQHLERKTFYLRNLSKNIVTEAVLTKTVMSND